METKVAELKIFVDQCKQHPEMLHMPALKFFKEYIESFGGKVPPPSASADAGAKECPFSGKKDTEPMETDTDVPEPEVKTEPKKEVPTIPMPELDNEGVIEADVGEPLPMGDAGKEVSDEDLEKANEERDSAAAAFSEGEFDRALQHFTNAIELNPGSAMLHAKRANCLLKLRRPVAAIADCSKAISINPDSATAYKFRGRANRLLGKWLEAHTDLAMACKLDYDDVANEWLKEVEPNAKKLKDWQLAKERQEREIEIEERRERVRRAQEANRKAAEEEKARREAGGAGAGGFPGGFPGMPGGFPGAPGGFPGAPGGPDEFPASGPGGIPPGMAGLFSDPEVMAGLQDPELQPILLDIMSNPANLMKHIGNPKVMKVISKMKGMFGGGAGPDMEEGGCCGGEDPTCGSGAAHAHEGAKRAAPEQPAPQPPRKAPEPDLD